MFGSHIIPLTYHLLVHINQRLPCPVIIHGPNMQCTVRSQFIWKYNRTGPEIIKLFPCSTPQSSKFNLLMNVEMPTIVGISTFISMLNTTPVRLRTRKLFNCRYFSFYEQLKVRAQLSFMTTVYITSGPVYRIASYVSLANFTYL